MAVPGGRDPRLEFQAQLARAMRSFADEQKRAIQEIVDTIGGYRDSVVASFAGVTEWDAARVAQVIQAQEAALARANAALTGQWVDAANRSTTLAILGVDAPLKALGLPADSFIQTAPMRELAILNDYVPTLIKGVTADVQKQVKGLMQRAALGGIDTRDMVQQVGKLVGPLKPGERGPGTIFSKAEIRARNIVRTETNRIHNLATRQRIDELSDKFPGVGKEWIHRPSNDPRQRHAALGGKVIYPAKDEYFELAGMKVSGPHDPKLPAEETINCHCGLRVVYNRKLGQQSAKDSPYVPGDGASIPSAKGRKVRQ